jgi:hypothetical protein
MLKNMLCLRIKTYKRYSFFEKINAYAEYRLDFSLLEDVIILNLAVKWAQGMGYLK